MNNFDKTYELIEDYLRGIASLKEQQFIEEKLKTDQVFKLDFLAQKAAFEAIELTYISDLSSKVKKEISKQKTKKKIVKVLSYFVGGVGVIASIVFLINGIKEAKKTSIEDAGHQIQISKEGYYNSVKIEKNDNNLASENTEIKADNVIPKKGRNGLEYESKVMLETKTSTVKDENIPSESLVLQKELMEYNSSKVSPDSKLNNENKPLNLCEGIQKPNINVEDSDLDEGNGKILFSYQQGMRYQIDKNDGFEKKTEWNDLAPGTYHLKAKTENGCEIDLGEKKIVEKSCQKDNSLSFNVNFDTEIGIKLNETISNEIVIFDRSGKELLKESLKNKNSFTWAGKNSNGELMSAGTYIVSVNKGQKSQCIYYVVFEK